MVNTYLGLFSVSFVTAHTSNIIRSTSFICCTSPLCFSCWYWVCSPVPVKWGALLVVDVRTAVPIFTDTCHIQHQAAAGEIVSLFSCRSFYLMAHSFFLKWHGVKTAAFQQGGVWFSNFPCQEMSLQKQKMITSHDPMTFRFYFLTNTIYQFRSEMHLIRSPLI